MIAILGEPGYEAAGRFPQPLFRRTAGGTGPIALKQGVTVDVDTNRHILGISSLDTEKLISEFKTVEKALSM